MCERASVHERGLFWLFFGVWPVSNVSLAMEACAAAVARFHGAHCSACVLTSFDNKKGLVSFYIRLRIPQCDCSLEHHLQTA